MKIKLLNKLSIKLIITVSIVLVCILSVYTYLNIKYLDNYLTGLKYQTANNISDLIKKSTRYSMLLNRREDVYEIIKTVGTEAGVKGIRIYNKQGKIIFSTDSTEVNKSVDVTAEACNVCHNGSTSLKSLNSRSEDHTSELQSLRHLVCRLLLEKKNNIRETSQHLLIQSTGLIEHTHPHVR